MLATGFAETIEAPSTLRFPENGGAMEILTADEGGIRVLRLVGAFETNDREAFQARVEESIDQRCVHVLVDAEQLELLSSTALGCLVRAQVQLRREGGELAVCALREFPSKVIATLGLDRKFRCFPAAAPAVDYLQQLRTQDVLITGDHDVSFVVVRDEGLAAASGEPLVGRLTRIGERGLELRWENREAVDIDAAFAAESEILLRFSLPGDHESHVLRAVGRIDRATVPTGSGVVDVVARFTDLADTERRAIRRFVERGDAGGTAVGAPRLPHAPRDSSSVAMELPRDDA